MNQPQSADFQQFEQLLIQSNLRGAEKKEAWRLFKADGLSTAKAYVVAVSAKNRPSAQPIPLRGKALPYNIWGKEHIDAASFEQMDNSMRLPITVAGALMPDAHKGYGLPIGGVLATDNAVIPYAVGVDIACRMMLTVYPTTPDVLDKPQKPEYDLLRTALVDNTIFGAGADGLHEGKIEHPVLDESNWQATELLRGLRQTAIYQIGTSGTGNHFVEWGSMTVTRADNPLGLQPGTYLALLSHSGSRGVGYKIADYYSKLAMSLMRGLPESVQHLAWLSMDAEAGQEYWQAMHLAGEFASANHHIIHERVACAAGLTPIASIENHHNFAWREKVKIEGKTQEAIVHRKGATPAGKGVLGIIPGTMADVGYVVMGKGKAESLQSASHGGGRVMSRNQAKKNIRPKEQADYLKERGVTLIGGGLDESPQAYKRIEKVIAAQRDLVDVIGQFQPRLVRMAVDTPPWKKKAVPTGVIDAEGD
jgi:tRNA-splicing ligase RtcB (3'-phosphate/5'-hydroxy nucleic acid ligase)